MRQTHPPLWKNGKNWTNRPPPMVAKKSELRREKSEKPVIDQMITDAKEIINK